MYCSSSTSRRAPPGFSPLRGGTAHKWPSATHPALRKSLLTSSFNTAHRLGCARTLSYRSHHPQDPLQSRWFTPRHDLQRQSLTATQLASREPHYILRRNGLRHTVYAHASGASPPQKTYLHSLRHLRTTTLRQNTPQFNLVFFLTCGTTYTQARGPNALTQWRHFIASLPTRSLSYLGS